MSRSISYVGTTTTNQLSALKSATINAYTATTVAGGFVFRARFAVNTPTNGAFAYVGMLNSAAIPSATVTPTTITNFMGFGYNIGDANWSIVENDASGNSVMTNLGSSFPTGTTTQGWYEVVICNYPPNTGFHYRITNLQTGANTNGYRNTDVPAINLAMYATFAVGNLTTGVAPVLTFNSMTVECLR
jgi:hypothetical protein